MTTLAAIPALLAVALSISSAKDYHYVAIPSNMVSSLKGEGMGASATTEAAPLRYEDAAFLTEALRERREFRDIYSGGYANPSPCSEKIASFISGTLYDSYYRYITDKPLYGNVTFGYGDPDAEMWDGIKDYNDSGDYNYLPAFTAIFSKGNWVELIDIAYADITNKTLRADYITKLYKYVSRATRPAMFGGLFSESPISHCFWKDDDYRHYASTYLDGEWNYGEQDAANDVTKTEVGDSGFAGFTFAETANFSAGREKARAFKKVTDEKGDTEWKDVTGECDFYYTKSTKSSNRSSPVSFLFNTSTNVCAALGNRKAKAVYLYAVGSFTYKTTGVKNATTISDRPFIMRMPASLYNSTMSGACNACVGLPGENDSIVSAVCAHFGVTPYDDAEALLADVPMPESTSSNHEDYIQKTTAGEYTMSVYLSDFYAVFDMEFNARVPSDSGGE